MFAGLQVLIWSISGFYMVVVDIDIIHGDHLVEMPQTESLSNYSIVPISEKLIKQYSPIQAIRLQVYFDLPVYELRSGKRTVIINALTGQLKESLTQEQVILNVKMVYAGENKIESVKRLDEYPQEIGGHQFPVWQVKFDDALDSTLYFHDKSGRLISKRTNLWRAFDIFWMLHIMDYQEREDVTNWLFRILASLSLLMSLAGSGLLYYRLRDYRLQNVKSSSVSHPT